ncbi:alpha/beta hydrolase [Haloferax mediterranei ATCC 33500]|uniref:Alpha/beta hydrolase n=1 Tax=Haloferax mediterranei (strain ATCC 33500 / DSM 1411 / JCM 8866 / NBRC 14739 / NCIMB 2177 / R-4) TaxID=523841 RepID=I3R2R5_HALMT|nr:alpha/beta hydrolase [Haloferax mediterranei]AFK18525.1 putative hydrolase or acyltransferase of alpha/beta superfamily [Haloferax mediterranei ATCC 33500]AHZ22094.1 alpha/beta hydrolase [Haloferax mediterranei ATCC 33500]EMA02201.1 alpha/beta hydrolase [Haloferax mediterranei ATCC 33500]MDX5988614.1 alpha/beta hydrolase [Haloferax mediterranei ATCC 33500]QCQ75030.1 alpha/beta hydrolase [Haloferax mediterranei ATCC 33500]
MKFRRAIGLAAAGVGLAAATNAALSKRVGPLEPPLSGDHQTYRWRGMDVSYVEAGDEDAPTLVFLHGINAAGSSGEFRKVFGELAEDYHVVAPDLPGFGLSDRPALYYSPALYEDFVGDFLAEYDDPAVIASSLTAAYTVAAASRDDVSVSRFVLICPTERGGPDRKEWLRELIRAPVVGKTLFNLISSRPSIRYFNADHGYYDPSKAGDDWQEYEWQTSHQGGARFAPASFISGYLNTDVDLGEALSNLDVPTTLVWGRESDVTPLKRGRELADEADCTLVVFDETMLLPHVEFPSAFVDTVRDALA